jgi:hypothetical protein
MQRLEDGHGRAVMRRPLRVLHEAAHQPGGQKRIGRADKRDGRQDPADIFKKRNPCSSSKTPLPQILIRSSLFEGEDAFGDILRQLGIIPIIFQPLKNY